MPFIFNDEIVLLGIWTICTLFAAGGILILILLIARRFVSGRRAYSDARRRQTFIEAFHAGLRSPVTLTRDSLPALGVRDYPILLHIAVDMVRTVQGEHTANVAGLLRVWGMFPHLQTLLDTGGRGQRIRVLTLLPHFGDAESLELLRRYARDDDPYVQLAALRGLADRSDAAGAASIIAELGASRQSNALMLADILGKFGEPALPALHALASSTAASPIRQAAIIATGHIGAFESINTVKRLLTDLDPEIRAKAAEALGNVGNPETADAVVTLLDDEETGVRVQAAIALGKLKNQRVLPHLMASLGDNAWWVRFRVAEALHAFGDIGITVLKAAAQGRDEAGTIARQVLLERADAR